MQSRIFELARIALLVAALVVPIVVFGHVRTGLRAFFAHAFLGWFTADMLATVAAGAVLLFGVGLARALWTGR